MSKLVCTKKDTGKRLLVDIILEPNYKEIYHDELGKPFPLKNEVVAPEIVPEGLVEMPEGMIKDYECGNCGKIYKTLKGVEKHLKKCK